MKTEDYKRKSHPEKNACPQFHLQSMAIFPVAKPGSMGTRAIDNNSDLEKLSN